MSKRSRSALDLEVVAEDSQSASDGDFSDDDAAFSSEDDTETPSEKRLRLAKAYLAQVREEEDSDDAAGDKTDVVAARLDRDRATAAGDFQREVARDVNFTNVKISNVRGHSLAVTAVCVTKDGAKAFSGSKDNSILAWDVEKATKVATLTPKWKAYLAAGKKNPRKALHGEVLALSITSDGSYLASGGRDKMVRVWDLRAGNTTGNGVALVDGHGLETAPLQPVLLHELQHHRDAVTSLAFQEESQALFSGSLDRSVKHWQAAQGAYVETLFGHQAGVHAVDCWRGARPLSAGDDSTARLWKLVEETHLVFTGGHRMSIDAASMVTEDYFLTGGSDGKLNLSFANKRKPAVSVEHAHGIGAGPRPVDAAINSNSVQGGTSFTGPHWICSIAAAKGTDFAATGSHDGFLRFWRVFCGGGGSDRELEQVGSLPVHGYVNSLAFAQAGRLLVAGIGRDHRLGGWQQQKQAKNGLMFIRLPIPES